MTTLIIAEHNGQKIHESLFRVVSAAQHWDSPVHVLVAGDQTNDLVQQVVEISGISKVIRAEAEHLRHLLAEDVSQLIVAISGQYDVILAAHSSFSRNILPRAAAMLDVAMISDVLAFKANDCYVRAIYAGDIHTTIKSTDARKIITVRSSNFDPVLPDNNRAEIVNVNVPSPNGKSRWLAETRTKSDLPDLGTAKVVVSGGRSLGSAVQFDALLSPLAKKLGAAIGATRAAVDAGYAPNQFQVGQTGVTVAPELYLAIGISGAVQHTAGMKGSRVIVAINEDPDAPIFDVADYGLVADLFDVVPRLTHSIQ